MSYWASVLTLTNVFSDIILHSTYTINILLSFAVLPVTFFTPSIISLINCPSVIIVCNLCLYRTFQVLMRFTVSRSALTKFNRFEKEHFVQITEALISELGDIQRFIPTGCRSLTAPVGRPLRAIRTGINIADDYLSVFYQAFTYE